MIKDGNISASISFSGALLGIGIPLASSLSVSNSILEIIIWGLTAIVLQLLCFIYPFIAIAITSGRIMQGLGKGIPVLLITLVRVVVISAPLGLYFTYILNKPVEWNWYAMMISAVLAFILAISWVRYELKKINLNKESIAI